MELARHAALLQKGVFGGTVTGSPGHKLKYHRARSSRLACPRSAPEHFISGLTSPFTGRAAPWRSHIPTFSTTNPVGHLPFRFLSSNPKLTALSQLPPRPLRDRGATPRRPKRRRGRGSHDRPGEHVSQQPVEDGQQNGLYRPCATPAESAFGRWADSYSSSHWV